MNSSLTLEIYKIDTERAMSHRDTVIETTIASPSKHKTEVDTTTSIQTDPVTSATHTAKLDTTVSIPAYTTTKPTTRMNLPRTKPPPVIVHSSVRASKDSRYEVFYFFCTCTVLINGPAELEACLGGGRSSELIRLTGAENDWEWNPGIYSCELNTLLLSYPAPCIFETDNTVHKNQYLQ